MAPMGPQDDLTAAEQDKVAQLRAGVESLVQVFHSTISSFAPTQHVHRPG